jgi:[acyl-carrier-protein] S-malonyltransferase
MEPAREELEAAIEVRLSLLLVAQYIKMSQQQRFLLERIKKNLIIQLTAPVMDAISTQMIADGATLFTEVGPGKY